MQKSHLEGEVFGDLTVKRKLTEEERENLGIHYKNTYYECQCICGNVCYIEGTKLTQGKAKSCGRLKRRRNEANA